MGALLAGDLTLKGLIPDPAGQQPTPSVEGGVISWSRPGTTIADAMRGHMFTDGSCTTSPFRSIRRASWSAVALDNDLQLLVWVAGPVFAIMAQSSASGEHCATQVAKQVIGGQAHIVTDYLGIVKAAEKSAFFVID